MVGIVGLLVVFLVIGMKARKINGWTRVAMVVLIAGVIIQLALSS